MKNEIGIRAFGEVNGKEVFEYTIFNGSGMGVSLINYGGALTKIITKDKNGVEGNVILGFDCLADYLNKKNPFIGSLIGRYANRIGNGCFRLNDIEYHVGVNDNGNTLHGGKKGFDKVVWDALPLPKENAVVLNYVSNDGEEGFPGELSVQVKYILTEDNALKIEYLATTTAATPVSLTSHAYFNLSAGVQENILDHQLRLYADKYIPVNASSIPTGMIASVQDTPMDFLTYKYIRQGINSVKGGYDHSWVLQKNNHDLSLAAEVYEPKSGRLLTMYTTEPALQFYTGNYLDGTLTTQNGRWAFEKHGALCLEAQHYPDSPNQPHFPNTILQPGTIYKQTTVYHFSIQ